MAKDKTVRLRKPAATAAPEEPDGYEDCIVSFIDVLGFRELLRKPAADVIRILKILRHFASAEERPRPRRTKELRMTSRAFSESVSDGLAKFRERRPQLLNEQPGCSSAAK